MRADVSRCPDAAEDDFGAVCQWCCHSFESDAVGIPSRRSPDGVYTVEGSHCSHACACAALFDKKLDSNSAWGRYQLLNDMAGLRTPVTRAPPREVLQLFGGQIGIDEFRGKSSTTTVVMRQPPTVIENARVEEIPSHHLYKGAFKPLDEDRVNEYKLRLSSRRPKQTFYTKV